MKSYLKKLGFGAVLPLLLVYTSGCSATAGIQPSKTTSTQFLLKMQTHQFSAAYTLLSSKCKSATTQQQMQNFWDLVEKNKGKLQSWSQQSVRTYSGTGGNRVNIGYALQCAHGTSAANFQCVEENQKWLIQGFTFGA